MADRKIRHVGDVFQHQNGHKSDNSDGEYSFNFGFKAFKNKHAPQPPGGGVPLPKIGNYQPKILLDPRPEGENPSRTHRHDSGNNDAKRHSREIHKVHNEPVNSARNGPFIIGDKDIPITVDNEILSDDEAPIPAPRRKRRAPEVPDDKMDVIPRSNEQTTNNPLYGRSMSVRSEADDKFDLMDAEIQGADIDFGPGIDNPGFSDVHIRSTRSSVSEQVIDFSESSAVHENKHIPNGDVGNYPYIPPPDYDDEEVTMTFDDEERDQFEQGYQHSRVYKEFEGEDFARYLQDDEGFEFDSRPPPIRHMKGKPAPRPPSYDNRYYKKGDKPKKKSKRNETDMKRNTIRDFSFSDSKIGWGDRTVKSTSAKGRYIKREKERSRIDTSIPQKTDAGSYEEFLRVRNGLGPLESPNSSDSGVEVEMKNHENMFYHSQPKQMRNGKYDKKPSVWQKLTWRFRKSVNISRMEKTWPKWRDVFSSPII